MVKSINKFGATVKTFLAAGYPQSWIARKLKVPRQKVNYQATHLLKTVQHKKRKLPIQYIKRIIKLASNKTTSSMSSAKITFIINKMLKMNKENMTIHKSTVCRILNKELGRPRKVKRVFYLTEDQKKQRIEFCEKMLDKGIKGGNIFFSDETKIDMGSYFNDYIRLTKENKEKLKKGSEEVFNIINRPQRKFEPSIMVAGGVCSYGLSNLIFLDGTENEFSYAQILFYFKDDIERLKSGNNIIYFEQDGATPHTTESNINLIKRLFGQDSLIQNPPNSPDLAYPIENLWAYIKPRIKKRNPKTLDELKKYTLEDWNNIPKKIVEKTGLNYIRRLKKVIEIKGERLEDFLIKEIRNEEKWRRNF